MLKMHVTKSQIKILRSVFSCYTAFVISITPLALFSSPQVFIAGVTSIYFVDQIFTLFGPSGGEAIPIRFNTLGGVDAQNRNQAESESGLYFIISGICQTLE